MPVNNPIFESFEIENFDLNAASVSGRLNVAGFKTVTIQALLRSGEWGATILQAQCSADGDTFCDTPGDTLSSADIVKLTVGTEWFRVRVAQPAGVAGACKLIINAKMM